MNAHERGDLATRLTENPSMSNDECADIGDHNWWRFGLYRASYQPQYAEVCRRCGESRWVTEPHDYEYVAEDFDA